MATFYHRDQPGSPALTYSTSASGSVQWDGVVAVLKACLVSGYGSQPAAGWELIAEAASYLVLRNGSHSGYVCLSHSNMVITISVAETYTGVAGEVIQGDGAKTGVAPGVTIPHKFMARYFAHGSANSSWFVVADSRTFIFGKTGTASTASEELTGTAGSAYAQAALYVGEDSQGNFIACGGDNTTNTGTTAAAQRWGDGFTALRDPATGLLVDTGSISFALPGCHNGDVIAPGHSTSLPDARLVPMLWTSGGAVSAFRGVCLEPRIGLSSCSIAAQMLGHSGPLMSRTAHTPIDLGDGFNYVVSPRYQGRGTLFLVTDNPEFWP